MATKHKPQMPNHSAKNSRPRASPFIANCIAHGAEAKLYQTEEGILKQRLPKPYRHPKIDRALQQFRTRREAKVLQKLKEKGIAAPSLIRVDDSRHEIVMSRICGDILRNVLEQRPEQYGAEMGRLAAQMHAAGIVHGDLTTSNMILDGKNSRLHIIDFGLSFFSETDEDRAVDLHVLREALEAKHGRVSNECYTAIVSAYTQHFSGAPAVLERLKKVEARGRNKKSY